MTLTELLVVMVIVSILVMLALPNLMPQVNNARKLEAKTALERLYQLERTYYMEHLKYSDDLKEIGFQQEKTIDQDGSAYYEISITEASGTGFKAQALAVKSFDSDDDVDKWEITEEKKLVNVVND